MNKRPLLLSILCCALGFLLTGCLTQRTVTSGGQTTSQKVIVKRPVKGLIDNTRGGY